MPNSWHGWHHTRARSRSCRLPPTTSDGRRTGRGRWHFDGVRGERRDRWFGARRGSSSGNVAFDEYREDTLRRLEDEQREFKDFLHRLRHAKDKAEFDQFMEERRRRPPETDTPDDLAVQPG